jgi:carbon storage regulator CsrA
MLILSRRAGEITHIEIVVSVVPTSGQRVRLAIRAPRSFSVRRGESKAETLWEYEHEYHNET